MPPAQIRAYEPIAPRTRLLDQVRETIPRKHYSLRTEATYLDWIKRYIFFHRKRHPAEMGAREMEQFLNHLAVDKKIAFIRHAFASKRTQYKDGAGAAGSQGCFNDDGLYTRAQSRWKRSAEPVGSAMTDCSPLTAYCLLVFGSPP